MTRRAGSALLALTLTAMGSLLAAPPALAHQGGDLPTNTRAAEVATEGAGEAM